MSFLAILVCTLPLCPCTLFYRDPLARQLEPLLGVCRSLWYTFCLKGLPGGLGVAVACLLLLYAMIIP